MGLPLAAEDARARRLLELASEVTGLDVPRALERGARALSSTEVLQPVLAAVALGAAHAAEKVLGPPALVLGHSLGELAAVLYACEVDDERAVAIARARGEAMAEAARRCPGGMLATHAADDVRARAERLGLDVAAENADDELVFSGDTAALVALAKELGARARALRALGPWHARSMAAAAPALDEALRGVLGPARVPVVSAVTGEEVRDGAELARLLVRGLSEPVRFAAAVRASRALVHRWLVVPPGKVVASLLTRNGATPVRADTLGELRALAGRS
jgi:[acyl-carrier-protein] S-malonyltransferase